MRAISILETWNAHGKTAETIITPGQVYDDDKAGADENKLLTDEERVKLMIETGYAAT